MATTAIETITMSMREVDRLKVVQAVIDKTMRVAQAAERLGITTRQFERLLLRYKAEGAEGLVSRKRGKPSNHQLAEGLALRAVELIRDRYVDFGPTLAREKLFECHGISLGLETVRHLMMEVGLWKPRKQRAAQIHQPRNRRACVGELIQIDGSDHAWFEERAPACTLLVFVDDATSRLMQLYFAPTESTFAYFEAARAYIERYGKPTAFYSDKAAIFRATRDSKQFGRTATQFGRALFELNIDTFCANSSQAKGRVERANLTLQDRLVKELRLREISTQEAANEFAAYFMADYNARFGKAPKSAHEAHRPLRADENLEETFTWRVQRKVTQTLTLQHERQIYLLTDSPANRALIHRYIDIWEYPDGRLQIQADGRVLAYQRYDRLAQVDVAEIVENKRLGHALQVAQVMQSQRDDRRSVVVSRTHRGEPANVNNVKQLSKTKAQRELNGDDLRAAIKEVCGSKIPFRPRIAEAVSER
ncbi:ISNCY family transposase [soil metagenome]